MNGRSDLETLRGHMASEFDRPSARPRADEIRAARRSADEADARLRGLVAAAFPEGASVRWAHGEHVRSGTVLEAHGRHSRDLRFRVRGASGAEYWIWAGRLLSFIGA